MSKKNVNKFLAGAITATMVATAVAPVAALADEQTIDFSDVSKESSHYPNIVKAAERGLMEGYQGKFNPLAQMTRGQVVKALGKYLVGQEGLSLDEYVEEKDLLTKVTPFEDVPANSRDQELFKYSLVVKDAKAFTGNKNNLLAQNNITREQMSKVLVEAFNLEEVEGAEANVADMADVQGQYAGYVTILSQHEITKADDNKYRPKGNVTRQQMASFLNRSYDVVHEEVEEVVELEVKSVSAINATQVEVKFTQAVDEDTVINAGKVKAANITFTALPNAESVDLADVDSKAELSEDGKTLTISTKPTAKFEGRYDVKIENVKSKDGENFKKYEETITIAADKTAPTVTGFEQINADRVKINFSEPMATGAVFEFKDADGKVVAGLSASIIAAGDTFAVVNLNGVEAGKKVTVTIKNAKDLAGNLINPQPTTIKIHKEELAEFKPEISTITQTGAKTFNIKFSEDLDGTIVDDVDLATTAGGSTKITLSDSNPVSKIEKVSSSEYKVTTGNNLDGVVTVTVPHAGVVGKMEQTAPTTNLTKLATFEIDEVAPVATAKLAVDKNNKQVIELTFDKDVTELGTVTVTGNYVKNHVTTKLHGTAVAPTAVYADGKNGEDNKKVIHIPLATNGDADKNLAVEGAVYNVTLTSTAVKSDAGTAMAKVETSFTRGKDGDTPTKSNTEKATVAVTKDTTNTVKATFTVKDGYELDGATATNIANYKIAGVEIESASLAPVNGTTQVVTLTLKEDSVTDSDLVRAVTVENVKVKNSTETMKKHTSTVTLDENVRPTVKIAKLTAPNEVTITFSEAVNTVAGTQDFGLLIGGSTVASNKNVTSPVETNKTTVVFELDANVTLANINSGLSFEALNTLNIVDQKGNKLSVPANIEITQ